jgi:hypothetical protein
MEDIQAAWEEARKKTLLRPVTFTTYRGTGHSSRPDKAVHVLQQGSLVVMVGDRGSRGPATLKFEEEGASSVRKFKSNAFFSLKNAGFEKSSTQTTTGEFTSGWDLWEACFQEHHSRSLEAKRLFVQLCGGDTGSAFADVAKEAGKVETARTITKAKSAYEGNPLYGLI